MILRFLFLIFLIYLAYKFVFDFLLPVYKTTRQIKKGFRNMQDQMRRQQEPFTTRERPAQQAEESQPGEYIDFEEVK